MNLLPPRILTRWMFWLPAVYLAFLCLAALDMAVGLTGRGEANLGAWAIIVSFVPAALVARAFGFTAYIDESIPLLFISALLQIALLMILGAMIDAFRQRKSAGHE